MAVNHSMRQSTRSPLGTEPSLGVAFCPGNSLPLWRHSLTACPCQQSTACGFGLDFFPTRIGFHPPSHIAHPTAGCPSRTLVGWVSSACLCLPGSSPAPAEPALARAFSQLGGWCIAAWGWLWKYPVTGGIPTQESFSGDSWVLMQELI